MNSPHDPMDSSSNNSPRTIQNCVIRLQEMYTCAECNKTFAKSRSLKMHAFTHLSYLQSLKQEVKQSDKCDTEYPLELEVQENEDIRSEHSYSSSECSMLSQSENVPKLRYNPKRMCQQKTFDCRQCKISFKFPWRLQEHESSCDGEKSYSFDESLKSSLSLRTFAHHDVKKSKNTHVESKANQPKQQQVNIQSKGTYSCTDCSKSYMNIDCLVHHFRFKHRSPGQTYDCDKCHDQFKFPWRLQEHASKCTGENPFACNKCLRTFRTNDSLYSHNRYMHENVKPLKLERPKFSSKSPFSCPNCGNLYSGMIRLRAHFREKHKLPGETYDCDKCDEKFKYPWRVQEHDCIHEQVKPYMCSRCQKSFLTLKSFGLHGQVHKKGYADKNDENNLSDDSYYCNECGKMFIYFTSLNSHFNRKHKFQLNSYKCSECNDMFKYPWDLEGHVVVHTGEMPYVCCICLESFSNPREFSCHIKTHNVRNTKKTHNVKKNRKNNLNQKHRQILPNSRFTCTECDKVYYIFDSLSRHIVRKHKLHRKTDVCDKRSSRFTNPLVQKKDAAVHAEKKSEREPIGIVKCGFVHNKQQKEEIQFGESSCIINGTSEEEQTKEKLEVDEHKCGECEALFPSFIDMKRHLLQTHAKSRPKNKSSSEQVMKVKQAVDLGEPVKSTAQRIQTSRKRTEKKCLNGREYHCGECLAVFSTLSKLRHHLSQIHKKENYKVVASKENSDIAKKGNSKVAANKENSNIAKKDNANVAMKENSKVVAKKENSKVVAKKENSKVAAKKENSTVVDKKENSKVVAKKDGSKVMAKKENLLIKKATISGQFEYQCQLCGLSYKVKGNLKLHIRTAHTESNLYRCRYCLGSFETLDVYTSHKCKEKSAVKRPYKCNDCGVCHRKQSELRIRIRRHHSRERPYKCEKCDKSFFVQDALMRHDTTHTGIKSYHCDQCSKAYLTATELRQHVRRVHLNDKRYTCYHCNKLYLTKWELRIHMRHHNREQMLAEGKFKCIYCDRSYTYNGSLKYHIQQVHGIQQSCINPEKKYKCDECSKTFGTLHSLKQHISHVHGTVHQCDKCMKAFPKQLQLRNHQIREHSGSELGWKCSVCDNSYCSSHYLNIHMRTHEKPSK